MPETAVSLIIEDNVLSDSNGTIIATVSNKLETARRSSYLRLFSTSPELLDVLENRVSLAIERAEKDMKPRPTMTGYRGYSGGRLYADLGTWVEQAVQAISMAYGEESNSDEDDLELTISRTEDKTLQDNEDNVVVRLSKFLKEPEYNEYLNLFLAAPILLKILDKLASDGLTEIEREYDEGKKFDPAGADISHFIVPDYLKKICDVVSKAKYVQLISQD